MQSRTSSKTSQADAPAADGHIPRGPTLVQGAACRHTAPPTCTHNHATQCTATRHTRWHCRMHAITCTKCRTRSLPHVRDVRIHAAAQQRAREVGQRLVTRHRRTSLMRDISLTLLLDVTGSPSLVTLPIPRIWWMDPGSQRCGILHARKNSRPKRREHDRGPRGRPKKRKHDRGPRGHSASKDAI